MSVDRIIASIPTMDAERRAATRRNAEAKLDHPKLGSDARRVIKALDAQAARDAEALSEHVRHLPIAKRIVEAFSSMPMTETERKVIQVLLDNPGLSSEALSGELGWEGQIWHTHFGKMCSKRESRLWPAEPSVTRGVAFYCGILAEWSQQDGWRMKPEVAAAFAELGVGVKDRGQQ